MDHLHLPAALRMASGYAKRPAESSNVYEVFLSFCGAEHSSRILADMLYHKLKASGVRVLRDDQELRCGEDISAELREAIRKSKISIALLSKGYASSKWCRMELAVMMRSRRKTNQAVLPLLYCVTPSQFRILSETFALSQTYRPVIVQHWTDVVSEVMGLMPSSLTYGAGFSAQFKNVAAEVLRVLKSSCFDTSSLVRIDNHVEKIMGLLDVDAKDVRMVIIHGMRGIGKTTLANIIYNKIFDQFEGCCFLKNIRSASSQYRICSHLQKLLAGTITEDEPQEFDNDIVARVLSRRKVLVVLDGAKQIDKLVGDLKFGLGSRIIITTRNSDILPKVEGIYEYKVEKLDQKRALVFSEDVLEGTNGFSFALKIVASSLYCQLYMLEREPETQSNWRICYYTLDEMQRKIFLDIACFFSESDVRILAHMWRDCSIFSEAVIEKLNFLSAIKIGEENKLWVHDQFRVLGRDIVRQELEGRSRFWGDDAWMLICDKEGKKTPLSPSESLKIEAIHLDYAMGTEQSVFSGDNFAGLTNLRYLDLANSTLGGNFQEGLSNLRWLGWHGSRELNVPSSLHLTNLVVLDLSGSTIDENWSGWTSLKEARRIEVLNLTGCHHLTRTPDFSSFSSMKRIILRDCSLLEMIDRSILHLKSLTFLDMRHCPRLKSIPKELGFAGELTELLIDERTIGAIFPCQVFLSSSLLDTHKVFADFLYNSLTSTGIRVFRDNKDGEDIGPEVGEVIKQAKVSIPIITRAYISCKRCRMDLAIMMERRRTTNQWVLPMFCDVTPAAVRRLSARYSRRFPEYAGEYDALAEVAALNGWNLIDINGVSGQLKEIAAEVLRLLKSWHPVGRSLVGFDNRVQDIMGLLDIDAKDVRLVWLHGMREIGKTTLANIIYNKIVDQFGGRCCFLKDICSTASQYRSLWQWQKLLVATIFERDHNLIKDNVAKYLLNHGLCREKVFVVLDDVDDAKLIDELVGNVRFGLGSRVIVTTRNVTHSHPKFEKIYKYYEVKRLDHHEALLLFCKNAFQQDSAPDKFVTISNKIVEAVGGHPLAVTNVASLFSRKENVGEGDLDSLGIGELEMQQNLKICYIALEDMQKEMFLDIACFFIGSDVRILTHMWRDCNFLPEDGIEVLHLMSMIKIGDDNKLWMHDQFRLLGRDVVEQENVYEPRERSRLWGVDARIDLQHDKEGKWNRFFPSERSRKVKAIHLDIAEEQYVISGDKFAGLTNLRYLDLGNANLTGDFQAVLPNLRWLGWHGHGELNIPSSLLCLTNLVVVDLSGSTINENWSGWTSLKEAKWIEVLNLANCHKMTRTPVFSSFPSMERIILRDCSQLETIDPSILGLKSLIFLDMRHCPRLKNVPKELGSEQKIELLIDESTSTKCDVFLSFWVLDDSHKVFADFLYNSLTSTGIHVFRGNKDQVQNGEDIGPDEVIKQAKVSIPIISKRYISNYRCLMDLDMMMECQRTKNQRVLPIFYDVSPSEVAEEEIITQWRGLAEVGALNSWNLADMNGSAQLIKLVVTEVSRILKSSYLVSDSFVGIDDRAEAIMRLLDVDNAIDVRMVGIHGMGGIGKTTLANFIYDKISHQFGGCCFLENVRDTSSQHEGLKHLQSLLVANILGCECPDFSSVGGGTGNIKYLLKHNLRNKKVLIVLDDVDHANQIEELIGGDLDDWLDLGSRIIITTRNRAVLPKIERLYEYEVKELDQHDAFLLFCKKAFLQDSPPDKLVAISRKIVEAAGGLPLSVETIGSYLSFQEYSIWEEALDRLKTEPDIQNKLKISYNALDNRQKQIFLDVACFFIGSDVSISAQMWRACNFFSEAGIKVLHLMYVIKIGDDNKLWVHDQLRDLGLEIVRQENIAEPGGRSRLWGKDALMVLQNKKGTEKVEALRLDYEMGSKQSVISGDKFVGLSNLRYLDLANATLRGNFHGLLSNLRWLGWHGFADLVIPPSLDLKNVVVLDLSKSTITDKWSGWSLLKDAKKLEVLNLTSCHHLTRTHDFSQLVSVKRLILRDCILLNTVDSSIGNMNNLTFLDVRNCPRLKSLPRELRGMTELLIDESSIEEIPDFYGMSNLETFSAKSCKSLCRIPESFGSLLKVQKVLLDHCELLTEIPLAIGQLESLKELRLSHTRVFELPDSVGDLSNLEVLNIDQCPITNLPCSLGRLGKLAEMSASHCLNLKGEIPFELDRLTSLRILRLDHTSITSIPIAISGLHHLHTLDLEGCMKLQTLPKLPVSLISLKVSLTSSVNVPNLPDLISLKHLEFQRCNSFFVPKQPRKYEPSSSFSRFEYEVFLSFRGPDTRASFTGILHERLTEVGIRTFIDSEDLRPGEEIGPNLLEAISQSKILIPIFTKGYASSKWCLMEAVKMAECMDSGKQKVCPIFLNVAPDEVRHQTGSYAESFSEHESLKKYDRSTIQEWRSALTKIGRQKGWDLQSSANWHQGEVIRQVVSMALKKLKKPYLNVTENLVGIDDHVEEVMRLLDVDKNDVRMLGIWGMGGIGKTTIAKFIYNQLSKKFEYCSFISDIRRTSQDPKGMESLQRQLISDILRSKYEKISSVDRGMSVLKECLQGKKVLVLLDDVDQKEQLNSLVAQLDWFGRGSRIIVTTRERDVLQNCKVEWIYEVPEMQEHNAFVLFCKHAFRQESPTPDFANLSWNIVVAAGGLPLAIEIIASYLSLQKREVWEEALDKLKTASDVHTILKISYDSLSHEQQEIFLDISCLFNGMDKRILFHMWKARRFTTPASAVQDLRMRALIKIRDDDKLWMHDILRDLGKEIVREKGQYELGKQSRLWCSKDGMEVLKNKKGTGDVQAIYLGDGNDLEDHFLNGEKFEKLPNLLFLGLDNAKLTGNFRGRLSNLRWLSWHGCNLLHTKTGCWPECTNMRSSLHLKELVILDLSNSKICGNWRGWNSIKEATNLEVLNLSSCHQLTRTPIFSTFLHMNRLILEDCQGLLEIDPSIGDLKMLEFLDMRNCSRLKMLPYKEFGSLVALTELLIDECPIQELPISEGMKKLRILTAKSCRSLIKIPSSIEFLVTLTKLLLDNCTSLVDIPSTIGHLESLRELSLSHTGVVYLPDSIENLSNLEVLNIDHCPIRKWPDSLVKLRKLEVLNASGCRILTGDVPSELESMSFLRILRLDHTSVNSIPKSIVRLSHLHTLDLKECTKLRSLPDLPSSLVILKVTCITSVTVQNLPELVNLKQLDILLFGGSSQIPKDTEKFSKIEKLTITIK